MSIKSSWVGLHKELKKLSETAGVALPMDTLYGAGDEYRRLTKRLDAVAHFLRQVNTALAKAVPSEAKKPAAKKPAAKADEKES